MLVYAIYYILSSISTLIEACLGVLYRRSPGKIDLIYNHSSKIQSRIASTTKTLTTRYDPPWFGLNSHVQLLMFCLMPQLDIKYKRELVMMKDDGQVALDWAENSFADPLTPIILVLHTLAGCSNDMREFCATAVKGGYRPVVFNKRGHGNSKLTTPKLQSFGCTSDMKQVLSHIQKRYPGAKIVGAGYSAGAGLLSSYLGEMGNESALAAGVLVSPGYDHYIVHANSRDPSHFHEQGGLHPIYNYLMAKSLQALLQPHHDILEPHIDLKAAKSASSMAEFDKAVYLKIHQFDSLDEYWQESNPLRNVLDISVPTLFISSKDDPVCPTDLIDISIFDRNPHLMLAFTTYGGHCGFYEINDGHLKSWAPKAAIDLYTFKLRLFISPLPSRRQLIRLMAPAVEVQRKLTVLGYPGVGKSSLTTCFVENRFVENYDPTIENTFHKTVRFKNAHFVTDIVDTAGMDEFSHFSQAASVGVHGYVLVYSITSRASFEKVKMINDKLINLLGSEPPRVLVGSMSDLEHSRQVTLEEGQQVARQWGCPFTECSAKQNENINEVFTYLIREIERDSGLLPVDSDNSCVVL